MNRRLVRHAAGPLRGRAGCPPSRTPCGRATDEAGAGPLRGRAGFTLLEVMAALSVFLIGVCSILALLSAGTQLHQESQNLGITADTADEVLLLAARELAERAPDTRDAPQGLPDSGPPRPVPSRPDLSYQWSVRAAPDASLYLLLVDLSWLEAGKTRKTTLERVLPRLQSPSVDARRLLNPKH